MVGLVRRQLEESAEHGREVVGSMNRFDQSMQRMEKASQSAADTMQVVAERSRETEDALRMMLQRSERRMTFLFGAMGLLCIIVIAGLLFAMVGDGLPVRSTGGTPPLPPSLGAEAPPAPEQLDVPPASEEGLDQGPSVEDDVQDASAAAVEQEQTGAESSPPLIPAVDAEGATVVVPLDAESAGVSDDASKQ
jgi:hypothetical protein